MVGNLGTGHQWHQLRPRLQRWRHSEHQHTLQKNNDDITYSGQAQYEASRDSGESKTTTDTNQGDAALRYSRQLSPNLNAFAASNYDYDTLNTVGSNTLINTIGLGIDVVKTKSTTVNLSAGPSSQSTWGGQQCNTSPVCGRTYPASTLRAHLDWKPNNYFSLILTEQFTGAYINGISPSNSLSGTLKIFPTGSSKLFTALSAKTIYNTLTLPKINNSFSIQLGTEIR